MAFETLQKRTSIGPIGVVRGQDGGGFRQAARSLEMAAGQQFQTAGQEAANAGKLAGENSVSMDENGNITKSAVQGGTIFNQAFIDAQRVSEVASYSTLINDKANDLIRKYKNDPDGLQKMQDEIGTFQQGLIGNINPDIKGRVELQMAATMRPAMNTMSDIALERSQAQSKANTNEALRIEGQKIYQMSSNGLMNTEEFLVAAQNSIEMIDAAEKSGVLTPAEAITKRNEVEIAVNSGQLINSLSGKTIAEQQKIIADAEDNGSRPEVVAAARHQVAVDAQIQATQLQEAALAQSGIRASIIGSLSELQRNQKLTTTSISEAFDKSNLDMTKPENQRLKAQYLGFNKDQIDTRVNEAFVVQELRIDEGIQKGVPLPGMLAELDSQYKSGLFTNRPGGLSQYSSMRNKLVKHAQSMLGQDITDGLRQQLITREITMADIANARDNKDLSRDVRNKYKAAFLELRTNPPMISGTNVSVNDVNDAQVAIANGTAATAHHNTMFQAQYPNSKNPDDIAQYAATNNALPDIGRNMLRDGQTSNDINEVHAGIQLWRQLSASGKSTSAFMHKGDQQFYAFMAANIADDADFNEMQKARQQYFSSTANDSVRVTNRNNMAVAAANTADFNQFATNFFAEQSDLTDWWNGMFVGESGDIIHGITGYQGDKANVVSALAGSSAPRDFFGGDLPQISILSSDAQTMLQSLYFTELDNPEIQQIPDPEARRKSAMYNASMKLSTSGAGFTKYGLSGVDFDGNPVVGQSQLVMYPFDKAVERNIQGASEKTVEDMLVQLAYSQAIDNPDLFPRSRSESLGTTGTDTPSERFPSGTKEFTKRRNIREMIKDGEIRMQAVNGGHGYNMYVKNDRAHSGWQVMPKIITIQPEDIKNMMIAEHPNAKEGLFSGRSSIIDHLSKSLRPFTKEYSPSTDQLKTPAAPIS